MVQGQCYIGDVVSITNQTPIIFHELPEVYKNFHCFGGIWAVFLIDGKPSKYLLGFFEVVQNTFFIIRFKN